MLHRLPSTNQARTLLAAMAFVLLAAVGCDGNTAPELPAVHADESELIGPVLLVGIDGASFDVIDPLLSMDRLPVLAGLIARGTRGKLATIEPTVSPAIWTTIATGKLPEAHGILGFEGVPGQSMRTLPTSEMRRVRAFWNVLSEHDRSVGVVGWWATWPAEPVNGYVVSDRAAYTRMEAAAGTEGVHARQTWPPEIADEVDALVRRPSAISKDELRRFMPLTDEEFEVLVQDAPYAHGGLVQELVYVHQADRSTTDIAIERMRAMPTDVTAVGLYGVDAVSHLAWHFREPRAFTSYRISADDIERFGSLIDTYYEYADQLLGELLAAAPPSTTVIVFSDHGFGPTGKLPWSGGHGSITPGAPEAPDGIVVLAGPGIVAGAVLDRAHVLDLMPTLLYAQGLPAAADMPGRVLAEAFRSDFRAAVAERRIPTYDATPLKGPGEMAADPAVDEAMREKLKALGYVQ